MFRFQRVSVCAWLFVLAACGPAAHAQSVPTGFSVVTVAANLGSPVAFQFLGDGRVLFAEQNTGRVRVMQANGNLQSAAVISVPGVVAGGERGLLGLAVDPRFPGFPYLYVFHDAAGPSRIRISRFTLGGDLTGTGGDLLADAATRYDLVDDIPDAAGNHNGGTLQFGLEGVLYASIGEDGVPCAAQDTVTLRGVILRLRIDRLPPGPGRAFRAQVTPPDNPFVASRDSNERLVAAFGLRNPFRFQIDRASGALIIGDVGESQREELDLLIAPVVFARAPPPRPARATFGIGDPLGANFGWPHREGGALGTLRGDCAPEPAGLAEPVFEYDRTGQLGGAAVISAGTYHPVSSGAVNWPAVYAGNIFASDYYSGVLLRLERLGDGSWQPALPVEGQPSIASWGLGFNEVSDWRVGPNGALWFCRQSVGFAAGSGSIGYIAGPGDPGPPLPLPIGLSLRAAPAVGSASFAVAADPSVPGLLTLHDPAGRVVHTWSNQDFLRGREELLVFWDGHDMDGRAVRPGMYIARLESAGRTVSVRVPFLR